MSHYFIGDPAYQNAFYEHQDYNFDCAVVSQMSIINQFRHELGQDLISEDTALYTAAQNGWVTEGGTAPDDVGKLMEAYGIPNHHVEHATVEQLARELQAGHRVVANVHAEELWAEGHPMQEFWNWFKKVFGLDTPQFEPADHAVVITGINAEANPPTVIINDSGDPNGQSREYPLEDFKDAWQNSDFTYTATDYSPQEWAARHAPDVQAGSNQDPDLFHSVFGDNAWGECVGAACVLGYVIASDGLGAMDIPKCVAIYEAGNHVTDKLLNAQDLIAASPDPMLATLAIGHDIYNSVPADIREAALDQLIATL